MSIEELVRQGKYKSAIKAATAAVCKHPTNDSYYRERAHLYLLVGDARKSRSDFDATISFSFPKVTTPGRLRSDSEFNAIGLTYWIEGHRELALAFWRYTTTSLRLNRVSYSHMGGGIEAGLLLWFGAVYLKSPEDIELTRALYLNRVESKHWAHSLKSWPGPIVRFFFKQVDEERLLADAGSSPAEMCEAHFALAIRARAEKRHGAYRKHLDLAAHVSSDPYDCYNNWAYFLARHETKISA